MPDDKSVEEELADLADQMTTQMTLARGISPARAFALGIAMMSIRKARQEWIEKGLHKQP
jgi:hypothetical protein